MLGKAKIVFSANLQETLGISCYEAALANAVPMVPDRLSYSEMYTAPFIYPSDWTLSMESYKEHREMLIQAIRYHINCYDKNGQYAFMNQMNALKVKLTKEFFSCDNLLKVMFDGRK
jgi:hypothetical protein